MWTAGYKYSWRRQHKTDLDEDKLYGLCSTGSDKTQVKYRKSSQVVHAIRLAIGIIMSSVRLSVTLRIVAVRVGVEG